MILLAESGLQKQVTPLGGGAGVIGVKYIRYFCFTHAMEWFEKKRKKRKFWCRKRTHISFSPNDESPAAVCRKGQTTVFLGPCWVLAKVPAPIMGAGGCTNYSEMTTTQSPPRALLR